MLRPCLAPAVVPGREVEVDMENDTLTDVASGKVYHLKPLGEVNADPLDHARGHRS